MHDNEFVMQNNAMEKKQTSNRMSREGKSKEGKIKEGKKGDQHNEQDEDNNMVAPAWTKLANEIRCMNHGKESTTNSYLLRLQARKGSFEWHPNWRCDGGAK